MKSLWLMINGWWRSITPREQRLVAIGSALGLIAVLYWGVLAPLQQQADNAQSRSRAEKQLLHWTQDKANRITSLRAKGGVVHSALPLNQIVSSSASRYRVALIRMQPQEDQLQVWIEPLAFDQLLNWIEYMQREFGVAVERLELSRAVTAGVVEVKRLQFKRS